MTLPLFWTVIQYVGFVATELTNGFLLIVMLTVDTKKLGAYKYLMISFTVFSIVYGIVEILTQPVMHIYGTGIIFYVNSFLKTHRTIGFHIAALYCSSFCICGFLLSTHFCYRYLAVCKPHLIHHFSGKKLLYMFYPPIIFGSLWLIAVELSNNPTEFTMEFGRESLQMYYGEDTFIVAHLSAVYYHYEVNGNVIIRWAQCGEIFFLNTLMTIAVNFIVYFTKETFKAVSSNQSQMSKKTHQMQKQLFYTLLFQSVVPFLTLFMPTGLFFILPFFNVNIGTLANFPSIYNSFYPAVDACIVFLMIKQFRNALCKQQNRLFTQPVSTSKLGASSS